MGKREQFWNLVCEYMRLMVGLLWIYAVLLILVGFSLLFTSPGSGAYVIALIDAGLLVVGTVVVLIVYRGCQKRQDTV